MIGRAALLLCLTLGGCAREATPPAAPDLSRADPALTAALAQPLLTDTGLTQTSNAASLRAPEMPASAAVPPEDMLAIGAAALTAGDAPWPLSKDAREATLAELAAPLAAGCTAPLGYGAIWATRLPPALPLPAQARVAEAAGSDSAGCGLRVVRFATAAAPAALAGWFAANGLRAEGTAARNMRYRLRIAASEAGGSIAAIVARDAG